MVEVEIHSGACGFRTVVQAETTTDYQATVRVDSECPHVSKMAENFGGINVLAELFKKGESKILVSSNKYIPHVTCPVVVGILKALEVSAGLSLPKDVTITFRLKESH